MKVTPVEIFKITDGGTIFFSTKDKPQRLHQDSYRRHRRLPFGAQHRQSGVTSSARSSSKSTTSTSSLSPRRNSTPDEATSTSSTSNAN
jgi:hypothetical protein